jgi:phosphate transport system substrate-binding protein
MRIRSFRRRWASVAVGALVAVLAVSLLAACGDDDDENGDGEPTEPAAGETSEPSGSIDYGSLSGDIRIDGSSTVYPITQAMAEEFGAVSDVRVNVAQSGTGGGFEVFCAGETQVSNASRPIEQDEIDACAANGIADIVEIQVAIDALTVMVHPSNDFVTCLTVQQLFDLFSEGGATTWAEIDPSWPAENIVFYYPGTDSGTFDYFVEAIIEEIDDTVGHRGDGTASEDDNILAQGIEADENAIGYFGFAYFLGAGQALKAVEVDGGGGCVAPSSETALDGTYVPLSRPLFIYTTETFLQNNPEVLGFANFYLENVATIVPEVGYVELPDDLLGQQVAKLEPFLP